MEAGLRMKKWFFGERKHIDQEKIEQEAKTLRDLRWLMDNASEQTFLEYVKRMKPDATPTEIHTLIEAFHEQRAARRRRF